MTTTEALFLHIEHLKGKHTELLSLAQTNGESGNVLLRNGHVEMASEHFRVASESLKEATKIATEIRTLEEIANIRD